MMRFPMTVVGLAILAAALAVCLAVPALLWGALLRQTLWIATAFGGMVAVLFLASIPKATPQSQASAPAPKAAEIDFDRPWRGRQ